MRWQQLTGADSNLCFLIWEFKTFAALSTKLAASFPFFLLFLALSECSVVVGMKYWWGTSQTWLEPAWG